MGLKLRVERLEAALDRGACSEHHVRLHLAHVASNGTETAIGPEPGPCPVCGRELDVLRIVIEAVPDRGGPA